MCILFFYKCSYNHENSSCSNKYNYNSKCNDIISGLYFLFKKYSILRIVNKI